MLSSTQFRAEKYALEAELRSERFATISEDDSNYQTRLGERNAKVGQINKLNERIITAHDDEDKELQVALASHVETDGLTPELRAFRDLAQRTDFETYFRASVLGVEIREGAEFEYNKHVFGNEFGIGDFPLEMFLPRNKHVEPNILKHVNERYSSEEYEKRTAITGTSGDAGSLTYVEVIFADSDAIYIGAAMPAVGPGRHSFPIVSSTVASQATAIARGVQQVPAGGITIVNANPESIRSAFTIANTDELVMPGIGAYLQGNILAGLISGLDKKVILDVVTAVPNNVPDTVTATLAKVFIKFGQSVDGIAAKTINDVRMLVGTADVTGTSASTYSFVSGLAIANVGVFATLIPHERFRGSPHFAIPVGDNQAAIAYRSAAPRGTRGVVAPIWRRVNLIRDPFSESDRDQTSFRGTLYADVVMASTQQHVLHHFETA